MPLTRDEKIDVVVATASVVAILTGYRRLAGAIAISNGVYDYAKKRNIAGTANMIVGGSFLFFPSWPEDIGARLKGSSASSQPAQLPAPQPIQLSPYQRVSYPSLDKMTTGGWTILDVRDIRDAKVGAKAHNLPPGSLVSLVMQNKNGPYMVFNTKVGSGGDGLIYVAEWLTGPPSGGPGVAEFGPEHVFAVR